MYETSRPSSSSLVQQPQRCAWTPLYQGVHRSEYVGLPHLGDHLLNVAFFYAAPGCEQRQLLQFLVQGPQIAPHQVAQPPDGCRADASALILRRCLDPAGQFRARRRSQRLHLAYRPQQPQHRVPVRNGPVGEHQHRGLRELGNGFSQGFPSAQVLRCGPPVPGAAAGAPFVDGQQPGYRHQPPRVHEGQCIAEAD